MRPVRTDGGAEVEGAGRRPAELPRVLVSVLGYNSPDNTIQTLRSLRRQSYPNYHLLLIDNASDEGVLRRVARAFPDLEIRRLPENSGYTGGNNFALRLAREGNYDCLLISTHDVEVGPRAVEYLVETAAAHVDVAAVGGVELDPRTGRARASAGGSYSKWFSRLVWKSARPAEGGREWQGAFCVHGAFLLLTKQALSQDVRMDEHLFMYFDEVDLGFQFREKGLRALVDRRVTFTHKRDTQTPSPWTGYLMQRNRMYVVRKHGRWFHMLFYALYSSLFEVPLKFVVRSLQGRAGFSFACLKGQLDGLRGSKLARVRHKSLTRPIQRRQ
jgi:GT2 family glycosyltransferase